MDIIDTKLPIDWVYVWLLIAVGQAAVLEAAIADESTARARRVSRSMADFRQAKWLTLAGVDAPVVVTMDTVLYHLWHGPLDIEHVPWVKSLVTGAFLVRAWDSLGSEVPALPRELTTAQELTLTTTWQTGTGRSGSIWLPGRPLGTPMVYM